MPSQKKNINIFRQIDVNIRLHTVKAITFKSNA